MYRNKYFHCLTVSPQCTYFLNYLLNELPFTHCVNICNNSSLHTLVFQELVYYLGLKAKRIKSGGSDGLGFWVGWRRQRIHTKVWWVTYFRNVQLEDLVVDGR